MEKETIAPLSLDIVCTWPNGPQGKRKLDFDAHSADFLERHMTPKGGKLVVTPEACMLVSEILAQAIIMNIRFAHKQANTDQAAHLRAVIGKLEEFFVEPTGL